MEKKFFDTRSGNRRNYSISTVIELRLVGTELGKKNKINRSKSCLSLYLMLVFQFKGNISKLSEVSKTQNFQSFFATIVAGIK